MELKVKGCYEPQDLLKRQEKLKGEDKMMKIMKQIKA